MNGGKLSDCVCGNRPTMRIATARRLYSVRCNYCGLTTALKYEDEFDAIDVWNDTVNRVSDDVDWWSDHVGSEDRE